jgi:hypothetical protein
VKGKKCAQCMGMGNRNAEIQLQIFIIKGITKCVHRV